MMTRNRHKILLAALAVAFSLSACQQQPAAKAASGAAASAAASGVAAPTGLESEDKQISYLLGYEMANGFGLIEVKKNGVQLDNKIILEAIQDRLDEKDSKISPELARRLMESFTAKVNANREKAAAESLEAGKKFLEENKAKEGVKTTESGLQYKVTKEGTGTQAALGDLLEVEYEGRLTNGDVFDGTKQHPEGRAFPVPLVEGSVIPGWIEGLQLMKEGGEYTLYIPSELAYGENAPSPKIPGNSVLVFDIKVNKVEKGGAKKMMEGTPAKPGKK